MSGHQNTLNRDCENHSHRVRGVSPNGALLVSFRKSLGLTQEQLGALADVDVKTVRKGESSSRMDAATLARIATALGLAIPKVLAESADSVRESRRAVIRRWQIEGLRRDIQRLLLYYHPDALTILPGEPLIPFSGRHQGHAAIASVCETAWGFFTSLPCRDCDQLVVDSQLATVLQCCSHFRTSKGQLFQLNCTHIFQFDRFQIIKHHIEYDTLALCRMLFQSPFSIET